MGGKKKAVRQENMYCCGEEEIVINLVSFKLLNFVQVVVVHILLLPTNY